MAIWNWWRFTVSRFEDCILSIALQVKPTVEFFITLGPFELEFDIYP